MKFLIVYAHPEIKSFCGALKELTITTLKKQNHEIQVSDLYAQNYNPVITKKDFIKLKNEDYFQYYNEQVYSYENNFSNYSTEIKTELDKLKWAENLIFIYPIWWGSFPAILKGWCDKTLVYGHSWTNNDQYETGLLKGKNAISVVPCEGSEDNFKPDSKTGMGIDEMLHHFNKVTLGFCGVNVKQSYVFYQIGKMTEEARKKELLKYSLKIENLDKIDNLFPKF